MSLNCQSIDQSVQYLRSRFNQPIHVAVILGSGLGSLVDRLENPTVIPYGEIPGFPQSTVSGHDGKLYLGTLPQGLNVAYCKGRFHYYEGHAMDRVIHPIRVLCRLGAKTLIVTNAAGGVNQSFKAGDLMLIDDHINMMGINPLLGENLDELGPRFPDMSEAYTESLRQIALNKAKELNVPLQRGVYYAVSGPSYETPAEIRMIRTLGGDAVGMSTVPEVIAARHMGINVLGISLITNMAAGVIAGHRLSHDEVLEAGEQAKSYFTQLMDAILAELPHPSAV